MEAADVQPHYLAAGHYKWADLDIWKTAKQTWKVRAVDGRVLFTAPNLHTVREWIADNRSGLPSG
jgi:hypothetical protein